MGLAFDLVTRLPDAPGDADEIADLSNAGVLLAFGVNDYDIADMLSKTIGRETITYETGGQSE